jgi:hypothetical protein
MGAERDNGDVPLLLQAVADFIPSKIYPASNTDYPEILSMCHMRRLLCEFPAQCTETTVSRIIEDVFPPLSPLLSPLSSPSGNDTASRKRKAEPEVQSRTFRFNHGQCMRAIPVQLRYADKHRVDFERLNSRVTHAVKIREDGEIDVISITFSRKRIAFFVCTQCERNYSSISGLSNCYGIVDLQNWIVLHPHDYVTSPPISMRQRTILAAKNKTQTLHDYLSRRIIDCKSMTIPGFICNEAEFMSTTIHVTCDPDNPQKPPRSFGIDLALKGICKRFTGIGIRVMCIYIQSYEKAIFSLHHSPCMTWKVGLIARLDDASAKFLTASPDDIMQEVSLTSMNCQGFQETDNFTAGVIYHLLHKVSNINHYCPSGFHINYDSQRSIHDRHGPQHFSNTPYPAIRYV